MLQPDHGVGITRRIQQITRGTFDVKPGSLFPALHRLEERGWLASQWGESENRRRAKYYKLTALGRREIDAELTNWHRIVAAPRFGHRRRLFIGAEEIDLVPGFDPSRSLSLVDTE